MYKWNRFNCCVQMNKMFFFSLVVVGILANYFSAAAFAPRSRAELKAAVDACVNISSIGNCARGPHGPIGSWDVSAVTDMNSLFADMRFFNQDLSAWNVSAVTNMNYMFGFTPTSSDLDGSAFNQDLSSWDVSAVTDMSWMFFYAKMFNQDLSAWDVSAVINSNNMFSRASSFNQDLSSWDVSAATDMTLMFYGALAFNQDLSAWDVSAVTDMTGMFKGAKSFDQKLCGAAWVAAKANVQVKTQTMFDGTTRGFIASCAIFRPQSRAELKAAVDACVKMSSIGDCSKGPQGPIGSWDVSAVTDMNSLFADMRFFNQDLSAWNVSAVTNMNYMFGYTPKTPSIGSAFNQDLSSWDVSAVTDMSWMFFHAKSFNQSLSQWDVSAVADMSSMFGTASSFNQDLSAWDVSAVINMNLMFYSANAFNQDLSTWEVSSVTNMNGMFAFAIAFNQDLSAWDVSHVRDMSGMFEGARSFDKKLCGLAWMTASVNVQVKKRTVFNDTLGGSMCTRTTATPADESKRTRGPTVASDVGYHSCLLPIFSVVGAIVSIAM